MRRIFTAITRIFPVVAALVSAQAANAQNACNPGRIYDQIQSGFHTTIATRPNGTFTTWGEYSRPTGNTNNLVPMDITPANGYAYTGTPLFASLGSNSSNSVQMFIMTTDGLYAWGSRGVVVQTAVTAATAFQAITMPTGVTPADVTQMIATYRALALVTTTGEVWISGTVAALYGSGPTLPAAATPWRQVTTNAAGNPVLTGVVDLRISPRAAFAVTGSGQWYTWGTSTYLGDGSAPIARDRATPMTVAFAGLPRMITMTSNATDPSYFALHPTNGMIYALGNNQYGQLGRGNTTAQAGWVTVEASAGVNLTNVIMISGNDQDGRGQEATMGAITSTERLYLWGSNSGPGMGGGTAAEGAQFTFPRSPNGFTFGTDVPLYVEVGGHTSSYLKECADRYCYIGHKINGSMGDNISAGSFIPSFDCANTPQALICGASSFDAGDVPIVYENNNAAAHYYRCPPGIYFGTIGPIANNGAAANVAPNADNNGTNGDGLEEDGITTIPTYTGSGTYSLTLTANNTSGSVGNIYAWIDWNANGIFEASEYQSATVASVAGAQTRTLTWTVPAVTCGRKYIRIRITNEVLTDNVATARDERSIGGSIGGEVEDYSLITTVPTSAGVDQHLVCNTQATCGTNLAGIGLGVWTAHPGNPGTATIAAPTVNNSAVSNFSAPGTYRFIFTSGTCLDTMQITFNVKPDAINDNATTNEDTPITVNLPGNDTDFDLNLNIGSVTLLTPPTNGTYVLNPVNGQLTYTPNPNFVGSTTFTYRICDFGMPILCDTATVTINVAAVNDPPVAVNDVATTNEDVPVVINILANDSDIDGNIVPSSVTIPTPPAHGTVSVNPVTGQVTYTPNPNYNGTDTFVYQVCDDGTPLPRECATATVTVTINPVQDPPLVNADYAVTNEDTPVNINVISNDIDVDGPMDNGSIVALTQPANGTIVINGITGVITYTPNPNFFGNDSFIYRACDNGVPLPALCDTAVVYITVNAVNDPPVAVNDVNTTPEDTPVSGNVSLNDSDVDSPILTYGNASTPANGTVVLNNDGTYTYTPNPNFNGTDSFTYEVCDEGPLCATATVTITVTPVNDPPIANADYATTNEDVPVIINVLANDLDIDGQLVPNTVTVGVQPANGTVTINHITGQITYTPNPNFNGTDTFIYQVCDNGTPLPSLCDTAVVYITVNAVNDPPVAVNDVNTTPEDTPVSGNVSLNDSDVDSPILTYGNASTPANGTVVLNNDGTYTYTPNPNFNGTDSFTYEVCDEGPLCATATVTITVTPVNDPPVANDDYVSTFEDVAVPIFVLGNDSDIDGVLQPNSVAIVTPPSHGTTVINAATGVITYTPNHNYNGTDSFSYIVCDNGTPLPALCDTAVVYIDILPVNDSAMVDIKVIETNEDSATGTICFAIIDDPADDHTATICGVNNGSATVSVNDVTDQLCVVYTPNPDYYGVDNICIVLCDNGTPTPICDTIHIPVIVHPVNDPPIANADFETTDEDTPVIINVLSNDTDIDGQLVPNTVTVGVQPANGTVTVNQITGQITYTPNPNFFGTDTFIYQVCDNGTPLPSLCDTAVVTVTVLPVNDPPVANPDNVTTPEDTPIVINVPGNDTDVDGNLDLTTVTVTVPPTNGTTIVDPVTGEITYTPNPNFNGTDVFTYSICDSLGLCSTATVTVTVTPVNDPPVIDLPDTTTPEDTPVTICSPITDPDLGNVFTATVCGGPLHGTISGPTVFNGQVCITYTPTLNYNGLDSICVIVCDNFGACDTSTTVITVTPVNDPPVANPDNVTTPEDTPVVINVPGNDTDVDGNLDLTTVTVTVPPTNGTTTVDPITGEITYTPNPNFNGTDVFNYSICDSLGLCATTTVTVTVTPVNDPPVIDLPDTTTPEDTPVTICSPITDPDVNNTFTVALCNPPSNGTATSTIFNGQVCVTYTPTLNYNGLDSVCVIVCDQSGACDTSTTVITVTPVNDPPIAVNDFNTTLEDTPVSGNVSINDNITDGPDDVYSVVSNPTNGTLVFNPDGTYTYTPGANFSGTDSFTYQLCDEDLTLSLCDTATVTITVIPVNDPPIANADSAITNEDTPVVINVLGNDTDVDGQLVPNTVTVGVQPANGTVTVNNITGEITYTPNPNFNGTDTFIYQVCDNGTPLPSLCDTAVVTVIVLPVNDPPVANPDNVTTPEDTPIVINVPGNDTDVDGNLDLTTVTVTVPPTNGTTNVDPVTGEITYTPNPNFNGTDVFTYSICDSLGLCATTTVTVTVTPVNDPPVIDLPDTTTPEDTPVTICSPITDPDVNNTFTATLCGGPLHGTITGPTVFNGQVCITYTPALNYNGLDSICVIVCDQSGACDTSTTVITVTPVNDPPVANPDNVTTPEDTPIVINVPGNDTDVDGNLDLTTVTVTVPPTNGTTSVDPVTGEITYTPNPNFNGTDVFTYSICDSLGLCATTTVTVIVTPVNDPPVIDLPDTTTPEDTPVTICSPITDPDLGNVFLATVCGGPLHGTITGPSIFAGQVCLTYTPADNYNGLDSICVIVCDNFGACDTSTTVITVTPVNDPPVANPDNATTPEDVPVVINVPGNDTDVDGNLDLTTVTVTVPPTNGTTSVDPVTGEITYTPNPNFNGTDVFTYSICDSLGLCATTTVTVIVTPVNDPPVIDLPDTTTPEDTPVTICSPITDPDLNNTFTAALCGGPLHGTITGPTVFNGQVCITYTPALNYNGLDSVCVIVCDQSGACDTSTTVITVTPVNDPPVANPDNATTPEDVPVVINVPGNDTDVDGNLDLTTVTVTVPPTNGTTSVDPVTGEITYTPNPNFNGTDVFTYSICDSLGLCATTTVTVIVIPVNDPPVIDLPDTTTPEDTPVTICSPITDPDMNNTFTATLCGGPLHGTVTGPTVFNGQVCITYTPTPNYNGLDSVCVIVCDQSGACDTSTTVITVTPVNDPPVAVDDVASTGTNTSVNIPVLNNDSDIDDGLDSTSVTIITPPTQGTVTVDPVTGVITYTPNANACGTDTFIYQVCDNGIPNPVLCDQATVTITINDTEAPAITCPANFVSSNTNNQCGFAVTGTALNATATDNCTAVTLTHNYTAWPNANSLQGASFPIGTTTVVWTAVDLTGNSSTCSFTVTINDTQAPSFLNCASGDTITMGLFAGDCEGGSIWPIPFATDNCANVTVTQTAGTALGSILPVGIYPITYTAMDASGNTTDCSFTFRIIDTQTPTIVCPVNVLNVNTTPGICGWTAPAGSLSPLLAQSNCNANVTWSVLNPDATTTTGANNVSGYTFGLGISTVTYTITENASGQTSSCSFTVTVTDNEAPIFTGCPSNLTVSNDAGSCGAIVTWAAPTASDNCAVTSFTASHNSGDSFPVGTTTVIYTAVDAAGNTSTCTFNVTVNDTELPVIANCPANVSVNNDAGICGAVVTWTLPTITDNCGATVTSSHNSGDVFPIGTTTVTYNAVDAAGNTASCSFTVTVTDNEAPIFNNCPANITVSNLFNTCYQQVYWPAVTASDNCGTGNVVVTTTHAPGFIFNIGTTTVTYTATDAAGNSTTCTFTVTVNDTQVPTIQNCPANITVANDNGVCGATVVWTQPAIFDNCPGVTVSSTHNSGDLFPVGTTTVTYTVTDAVGNSATCTFDVTVNDTQAPIIAGCPANINVPNTTGVCGAVVTWTVPSITDNCPGVTFTSTHNSGDTFPLGTTTVTYMATDVAGNVSVCSFNITVSDTELPTITNCPANIAVNTDAGVCGAVVTWTVPAITDNCAGMVITSSHTSGSTFAVGTTTVTYTATDASGNVSVCSFDVTVTDNLPPVLTNCPADINVGNAFNFCGSPISWVAPTFTDNCPGMTVVASHTNGTVFPIGTTTVTYTATDISGNVTTCSFNITITDTQVPQITNCPPNITVSGNPSCSAVVAWTIPSAFDNCPGVILTSTHNPGDVFTLGTTTVVYTATDVAGNSITCSFDVIVTDNSGPVITNCPTSISVSNDAGVCGAAVTWTAPTVTDNCSVPTVTSTHNSGDVFPIGTTTVIYTATDAVGNESTCSFTVTVNDTELPTIANCSTNVAVNNTPGTCGAVVTWTAPTITDNCPGVTFTSTHTSGSTFPIGTTAVTYTATDIHGNVNVCSFTVTVTDNEAPVLSNCPADITVNQLFNICGAPVLWTPPTFTDNCSAGLVVTTSHLPGTTFPAGTTTVTYTATDASGNVTTCSFDITVNDTQAPVISACPIDVTINSTPGICGADYRWVLPTAFDNCPGVVLTTTHAPGSTFPVGTTTVTYTATDVSGNTATCSFNVTVLDVEAPVIVNCTADVTVSNTIGNCDGVATWTAPTATDNCGVASLTSSHNSGDVFPVGTTTVVYTATDTAGNITYCRFIVTVEDTELPVIAGCPANINSCTDTVTWVAPTATDNCSIATLTSSHNSGDIFPVGVTTVTYTATDSAGNVSTCSFNVTVSMPKLTVVYEDVSCNGANDGTATVIVTDAVGPLTFNWGTAGTDSVATGLAPGTYTVVVNDGIGCSATASVTITEPTVLTVDTVSISIGSCGFADGSAIVLANGGTAPYSYSWSNGQSSATLTNVGDGFYTVTVTDANGCQDSLTINVSCEIKQIPQLLTPNGDGHNDTWVIPGIDKYPNATVEVYNRWGNLVYKAAPYLNDWAGISTGMLNVGKNTLPAGTYFYVIRLHPEDKKAMTGYLELQY